MAVEFFKNFVWNSILKSYCNLLNKFYHISKNSDQEKQMTSPNDSFRKFMQGGQCLIIVFFHRRHRKKGFNLVLRLNLALLHHMHHWIDGITISKISLEAESERFHFFTKPVKNSWFWNLVFSFEPEDLHRVSNLKMSNLRNNLKTLGFTAEPSTITKQQFLKNNFKMCF